MINPFLAFLQNQRCVDILAVAVFFYAGEPQCELESDINIWIRALERDQQNQHFGGA